MLSPALAPSPFHPAQQNIIGGKKTADMFGGPKKAMTIGTAQGHCSHYG